jgi:hypothetical protein
LCCKNFGVRSVSQRKMYFVVITALCSRLLLDKRYLINRLLSHLAHISGVRCDRIPARLPPLYVLVSVRVLQLENR